MRHSSVTGSKNENTTQTITKADSLVLPVTHPPTAHCAYAAGVASKQTVNILPHVRSANDLRALHVRSSQRLRRDKYPQTWLPLFQCREPQFTSTVLTWRQKSQDKRHKKRQISALTDGTSGTHMVTTHATLLQSPWFSTEAVTRVACHTPLSPPSPHSLFSICRFTTKEENDKKIRLGS